MKGPSLYCCLIVWIILIPVTVHAQSALLDSLALDTVYEYTSLKTALKAPEKVIKLNLTKNKLKEIPPEIFQFNNLQVLILRKNKLDTIPPEIGNLQFLQELDLSKNNLEYLPGEIGKLKNLKYLILGRNKLKELPREMGLLESLEYLDLWSNDLKTIPPHLADLENLREIDLRVVQINKENQREIFEFLPNTTVHFSKSCNCD